MRRWWRRRRRRRNLWQKSKKSWLGGLEVDKATEAEDANWDPFPVLETQVRGGYHRQEHGRGHQEAQWPSRSAGEGISCFFWKALLPYGTIRVFPNKYAFSVQTTTTNTFTFIWKLQKMGLEVPEVPV